MGMVERPPGSIGELVSQHRNSEGELVTVERIRNGSAFDGQEVLCLYDDSTPTIGMMLLDVDTKRWLIDVLTRRKTN